jgi:hypothetical protein
MKKPARRASVELRRSLRGTAHPLYTRFTELFGTSLSETTMQPKPYQRRGRRLGRRLRRRRARGRHRLCRPDLGRGRRAGEPPVAEPARVAAAAATVVLPTPKTAVLGC